MSPRFKVRSVVALSGGVGGARFAYGLSRALPAEALTIIVNTGDDFVHWGLAICPDLDTVMYTLSELSDDDRGWGLANETFAALEGVKRYGGDSWFMLGDRDLATHLVRTEALACGQSLSEVTARLCRAVGIRCRVLPMADEPCRTMIDTEIHGPLPFQRWFVEHRCPPVRRVRFDGDPAPAKDVLAAIETADLVVIGPSNPYVSIDPILTRPGVSAALEKKRVVAVSPIVAGKAVKGPLGEMIPALAGVPASTLAIARHYGGLLIGLVVESGDEIPSATLPVLPTSTIMRTRRDRVDLAEKVLAWADSLA